MEKLTIKRIITILLIAIVMISISTKVLATDELTDPTQGSGDGVQNAIVLPNYPFDNGEEDEGTTAPTTPTTPTAPSQGQETLPQTGDASDYAIFLAIALFAVVSIYAYRKVKDYNKI